MTLDLIQKIELESDVKQQEVMEERAKDATGVIYPGEIQYHPLMFS